MILWLREVDTTPGERDGRFVGMYISDSLFARWALDA